MLYFFSKASKKYTREPFMKINWEISQGCRYKFYSYICNYGIIKKLYPSRGRK